jgi:hypothetical protein
VGKLDNPKHIQDIIPQTIKQIGFNYDGINTPYMWNKLVKQHAPLSQPYLPTYKDI